MATRAELIAAARDGGRARRVHVRTRNRASDVVVRRSEHRERRETRDAAAQRAVELLRRDVELHEIAAAVAAHCGGAGTGAPRVSRHRRQRRVAAIARTVNARRRALERRRVGCEIRHARRRQPEAACARRRERHRDARTRARARAFN